MRIVIISRSESLEQMISYIVGRGIDIEIVGEAETIAESGQIVSQEQPDWLFLLTDSTNDLVNELQEIRAGHKHLNVAALDGSADRVHILQRMQPGEEPDQAAKNWKTLSLSDFGAIMTEEPALDTNPDRITDKEEHRA